MRIGSTADMGTASPHGSHARRLIVNADDFGQSAGVNEGIIHCHEHGIVTSASLMVRWPSAAAAAEYARAKRALSVGLHIDLGEWTCRNGEWVPLYQVVAAGDLAAIQAEIVRQLDAFRRLMHCDPTHIDSHQHVHHWGGVAALVREIADEIGTPVRECSADVQYNGAFYGQGPKGQILAGAISIEHLIRILMTLPEGTTELGCHPGVGREMEGLYVAEREQELQALCDPRVGETLAAEGIELMSFRDIGTPRVAS